MNWIGTTYGSVGGGLRPRGLGLIGGLLLLGACDPSEAPTKCPGEVPPTFTVTVRAVDGPLPADTKLTLQYGSGMETFALDEPPTTQHSIIFCSAGPSAHGLGGAAGAGGEGGAGGAAPDSALDALVCDLYPEGAATLSVTGGEYPELLKELEGETNDCGPETVDEELILGEVSTNADGD